MMIQKNKNINFFVKKGFSLIEVLVVIFIITLTVGLTLTSFRDTKAIDEVESAARIIAGMIRESQNMSLTGAVRVVGVSQVIPCGNGTRFWALAGGDIVVQNHFYQKQLIPVVLCQSFPQGDSSKQKIFKNITITGISSPAPSVGWARQIRFDIPSGKVSFPTFEAAFPERATTGILKLEIASSRSPAVRALVCVYPSGAIQEVFGSSNCP